ncbi:MAG: GAF domain-containing protein [Firmicutes bacterium]|nr:GAF domain-containing protein [Bacillota bacterium]
MSFTVYNLILVAVCLILMTAVVALLLYVRRRYRQLLNREKEIRSEYAEKMSELHSRLAELSETVIQYQQMLGASQEQTMLEARQKDLFLEISHSLTQTLDLPTILDKIISKIRVVVPFYCAGIYLYSKEKSELYEAAFQEITEEDMKLQLRRDFGIPDIVVDTNRPVWIADVEKDPRFKHFLETVHIGSAIYVPISTENEVYGILFLGSLQKNSYGQKQMNILSPIVNQAFQAIRNARLFQEVDSKLSFMSTLWDISRSLNVTLDVDFSQTNVLTDVVEILRRFFKTDKAVFFRYDEESYVAVPFAFSGFKYNEGFHSLELPKEIIENPQKVERFMQVGEFVNKYNVSAALTEFFGNEGIKSFLRAPLIGRRKTMGSIVLFSMEHRAWTQEEIRWLDIFAGVISSALENSILFSDLFIEKNRLQVLVQNIPDGVFTIDTSKRILSWNTAAEKITGWQSREVIGKACRDLFFHSLDGERLCDESCLIEKAIREKRRVDSGGQPVYAVKKEGQKFPVFIGCAPIINEEGEAVGAVQVFRDRSAEMEIERMKEDFFDAVTHDLKSPLSSVMGYIELVMNPKIGELTSTQREYIESSLRSARSLLLLINNLLEGARIDAGKMVYNFAIFAPELVVSEVIEMFMPAVHQKGIKVNLNISKELTVYGDRDMIKQVFMNLFSNAMKFTSSKGIVTISAEPHEDKVKFSVADTGKGIPPENREGLFQKFYQVGSGHV